MRRSFLLLLTVFLLLALLGCSREEPAATEATQPVQTEPTPTAAPTETPTEPPTEAPTEPPQPESFLLTFVGDCTFGSTPKTAAAKTAFAQMVKDDYSYPMANVRSYFENDDCSFANLEGVLGDKGNARQKSYVFRGKAEYTRILTDHSVEAVTLANNHSMDYGEEGYEETKRILEERGVIFAEHMNSTIFVTDRGLTIGLYAMSSALQEVDEEQILEDIRNLKASGVDIVVCAFHWGAEGSFFHTHEQEKLGRAAIDAGASIVWGHHPHVLQPMEEYNGGVIFYSLGNFIFGGNASPNDKDTAIMQQEVIREPDGTVRLGELTVIPCSVNSKGQSNNFQPTPYPEDSEMYERVLKKLADAYR